MGTGNFYALCGQYYIIESDGFDNEFDFEVEVEALQNQIISGLESGFKNYKPMVYKTAVWDYDRNYPGKGIAGCEFTVRNINVDVKIVVYLRSGYYEDYNLDYQIEFNALYGTEYTIQELENCQNFDNFIEDILRELVEDEENERKDKSHITNVVRDLIKGITQTLDKILSSTCDYVVEEFATFNNGEVIYKKRESV